jgi:hypothetical protein
MEMDRARIIPSNPKHGSSSISVSRGRGSREITAALRTIDRSTQNQTAYDVLGTEATELKVHDALDLEGYHGMIVEPR